MESKVRLKDRLSRLFRLRSLGSSCTTATAPSIHTPAAASIANKPTFITRHRPNLASCDLDAPLLDNRRPYRTLLSAGCGSCRPTAASPAERAKKNKKERTVKESSGFNVTREGDTEGGSPSSPSKGEEKKGKKKRKTKQKKNKRTRSTRYEFRSSFSFESIDDFAGFFSSKEIKEGNGEEEEEEEVDTKTFFSVKSFSSDSSDFYKKSDKKKKKHKKKEAEKLKCSSSRRPPRRRRAANSKIYDGFRPLVPISSRKERWVKEEKDSGCALVKKSSDPYGDFRSSMVEMIVKRQIYGARELQWLIHSYLSLNSPQNHPVILRAIADISQVLFSY